MGSISEGALESYLWGCVIRIHRVEGGNERVQLVSSKWFGALQAGLRVIGRDRGIVVFNFYRISHFAVWSTSLRSH